MTILEFRPYEVEPPAFAEGIAQELMDTAYAMIEDFDREYVNNAGRLFVHELVEKSKNMDNFDGKSALQILLNIVDVSDAAFDIRETWEKSDIHESSHDTLSQLVVRSSEYDAIIYFSTYLLLVV